METMIVLKPADMQRLEKLITDLQIEVRSLRTGNNERPLTKKEAAKLLGINPGTINERIKKGIIPTRLVHYQGTKPYFFESELVQYIKGN